MHVLEIEHITKRYGHAVVAKDLSMGRPPAWPSRGDDRAGAVASVRGRFVTQEGGGRWRFKR
jgi:hypothetical protein